tara:strand:+ start:403 stop:666 length:264 start_codon:yes stop_codon:yes gene_type:complete
MSLLPEHIQNLIILDTMLLKKNEIGWKNIHLELKNSKTFLKRTNYVFEYCVKFEHAKRMPRGCLNDIFSMEEDGTYIDDMCIEISYW